MAEGENLDKYLKDIALIKRTMDETDERPIIENWAYFAWGFIILGASILHFLLYSQNILPEIEGIWVLWIPVLVVIIGIEIIAGFRQLTRKGQPLFTRRFMKFLFTFSGILVICLVIFMKLLWAGLFEPGFVLLINAVLFFAYAQYNRIQLFIQGGAVLLIGLIFHISGMVGPLFFLLAGIISGIAYISYGVMEQLLEKKK